MPANSRVYVIGAGFSAALGFPLTHDLLVRLWERRKFSRAIKSSAQKVVKFFHPAFDPTQALTFPTVEQLLSEIVVNQELFLSSRRYEGNFREADLEDVKKNLLRGIGDWFHDLSEEVFRSKPPSSWLNTFRASVNTEKDTIISFNWDLIIDRLLFEKKLGAKGYGLGQSKRDGPILLKPHGSLNWFEDRQARYLSDALRVRIFGEKGSQSAVHLFTEFRSPISKKGRFYDPLIVPPVFSKNFEKPIFKELWNKCTEALSTADEVVFLGYSMPTADLHAQFILRCGFHNQVEGIPRNNGRRDKPTGAAKVIAVNPDQASAARISAIVGPDADFSWRPMTVARWIEDELE